MLLYLLQKEGIGLGKEAKTNAMRMLDKKKIAYEALTYEVDTFIDGMHCAEHRWNRLIRHWSCREKANNTMCL